MKRASLNHTFRLVWNAALGAWVAVAEITRSRGKRNARSSAAAVFAILLAPVQAQPSATQLPTEGSIVAGSGSIQQHGSAMTVTQTSQKMITEWQSFSIGRDASVTFNQPNAAAISLNRVTGTSASMIEGAMRANGQVFLVNPNGVIFGNGARVDVGGLVASTLQISSQDFLTGNYRFSGDSGAGSISNAGSLNAPGGVVALLAPQVSNSGTISTDLGSTVLAAGSKVTLDFVGDGLVKIAVDQGAVDALVENKGLIRADGGLVVMSTQAASDLLANVVNSEGVVQARTLAQRDGRILMLAGMREGEVRASGTLDASGASGSKGGFLETSAAAISTTADLKVSAGHWLIDPVNISIDSTLAGNIQNALGSGDVTINTNGANSPDTSSGQSGTEGNITVNAGITWSANKLTLQAHKDITLNKTLNLGSGTAQLDLGAGWDGSGASSSDYNTANGRVVVHGRVDAGSKTGTGHVFFGAQNVTLINAMSDIPSSASGLYALGKSLDMSAVAHTPITGFAGTFNGLGNQITNLVINTPTTANVGLFGSASGARFSNLRIVNASVSGRNVVGTLVGNAGANTSIINVHASGSVTAEKSAGGASDAGGLVGDLGAGSSISYSSANVNVSGSGRDIGGLVGYMRAATVSNSFATGNVSTSGTEGEIGGLVGGVPSGVTGGISNAYATGSVTAAANTGTYTGVGGLVGAIRASNPNFTITDSYAAGSISSTGVNNGTLVGLNNGVIVRSEGGKTQTTQASYLMSNFADHWSIVEGYTTPFLKALNSSAFMLNRDLTLQQAPTLELTQNINTVSVLGSATLTLKSAADVVLRDNRSIISSGGKLNAVFWSDSNGDQAGGVLFDSSSKVDTNDGHLWVGGGSGSTTWNGLQVGNGSAIGLAALATTTPASSQAYAGINMVASSLNAGSGNVYMSGTSTQTGYRFGIGLRLTSGSTLSGGAMTLKGTGSANLRNNDVNLDRGNWGVLVENASAINATGNIVIEGSGGGQNSNGGAHYGVFVNNATVRSTGSSTVSITGTGGGKAGEANNTDNDGIRLGGTGLIQTDSGAITLTGSRGINADAQGIHLAGGSVKSLSGGAVSLITNTLQIDSAARLESSAGTLDIRPLTAGTAINVGSTGSGTLDLASSYFSTNFVNGFSGITVGSANAGSITVAGSTSHLDNLTLKTAADITLNEAASLSGQAGQNAAQVLWSDADGSGSGSIYLKNAAALSSNGGHIWLGGGSGSTSWNGLTVGDSHAAAGTPHENVFSPFNYKNGITLYGSSIDSGGGNISLKGQSLNQSGAPGGYMGIHMEQASIASGNGNIDIVAISSGSNNDGSWHYGLLMGTQAANTTTSITSTGGTITINGETAFSENTHGAGVGLYSFNNPGSVVKIASTSGAINITGKLNSSGYDGQYGGIYFFGSGDEMITSQSGNIRLTGTSANANVASINVHPSNSTSRVGYDGSSAYTGNITLDANTFINYDGAITANQLELLGSGVTYTLNNTANNVTRLIANTGNVAYVDADALTLGNITASGKLNIATASGNLTLDGNLQAGSTGTDAVVLNAGKNTAAGTAAGGNIIHNSGSLSTGSGGRATLYTGSIAGSTGLTTLIGSGSGRFRYNSDEASSGYSSALGSGSHAIYREQPTITVTADNASKTYDGAVYSGYSVAYGGFVNGDTSAVLNGTLTYGGNSQSAVNAGSYTISSSGLGNTLGYAVTHANGTLNISPRSITLQANDRSKNQGDILNLGSTGFTLTAGSLAGSESISSASLGSANGYAGSTTQGGGTYADEITISNASGGNGFNAGNYSITYHAGDLTIIGTTTQTPETQQTSSQVVTQIVNRSNTGGEPVLGNTENRITSNTGLGTLQQLAVTTLVADTRGSTPAAGTFTPGSTAVLAPTEVRTQLAGGSTSLNLNTASAPISLSLNGPSATLKLSSAPASQPLSSSLPVFAVDSGGTVQPQGSVKVDDSGNSISVATAPGQSTAIATPSLVDARRTTATLALADGSKIEFTVMLSSNGLLVIRVPAALLEATTTQGTIALAVATAKTELDADTSALKGVLLERT